MRGGYWQLRGKVASGLLGRTSGPLDSSLRGEDVPMNELLSVEQRTRVLSTPIRLDALLARGALERLAALEQDNGKALAKRMGSSDVVDEAGFRSWAGFGSKESISLGEGLEVKVHPHFVLWVVMDETLVAPRLLHYWNLELCRAFLADLKLDKSASGELSQLLESREAYVRGEASLGNVRHDWRRAKASLSAIHRGADKQRIAAGYAVESALWDDPVASFRQLIEAIKSQSDGKSAYVRHLAFIKKSLH